MLQGNSFMHWGRLSAVTAAGLLAFSTFTVFGSAKDTPVAVRSQVDAAIAKVRPALVRIRVVSTEYSDGREIKLQEVGSGAIITKDGYIITNHHVAGHAARMFCTLWNREEVEAELIGTDPLTDISIIKLKPDKAMQFQPVSFGDSAKLRVGDYVLAMGSPMALSQSVTLGIVSNTEMIMPRFWGSRGTFRLDGEDVGALVRWIGHDAAIYGGNSGGPLVNLQGEIVGINEISYGLSGAIPGNLAKSVADQIIAKGKVSRSWVGLDVQPLFKRGTDELGVMVGGVLEDSPAAKAGLQAGDILLSVNGHPTNVRFAEQMPELMLLLCNLPVGREVPIVVKRDGKEVTLKLAAAVREDIYPPQKELKQWGMTVRNFSALLAREMKRTNLNGVVVSTVRPGGPAGAAKPAIERGDVLLAVDNKPVNNLKELTDLTHAITDGKKTPVPVMATFERKSSRYLAVVRVGLEEVKDPGLEVTKAWLPVETQVISREIAKQLGDPALKGFYITRVYPDTSAAKAGLQPGDFIVAVDGEKLSASDSEYADELSTLIRQYDVGKTVELSVIRDKKPVKVSVELARSPRLTREMKKYRNNDFDFSAREVSFFDTVEEQWNSTQHGVLVEDVKTGSWAELGGLYAGDLILEVGGQPINSLDDLKKEMDKIAADKNKRVIIKVLRGIHTSYLEIEPNWKS
jgi:serine protease Do